METLKHLSDNLEIIFKNFLFSLGIILLAYILFSWISNLITIIRFKREWRDNLNKYSTKRCLEEPGLAHIYLVDDKKKIAHRMINPYTINRLGYFRPPKDKDDKSKEKNKKFYFKFTDKYELGPEIKIRDIASIINTIKDLKN